MGMIAVGDKDFGSFRDYAGIKNVDTEGLTISDPLGIMGPDDPITKMIPVEKLPETLSRKSNVECFDTLCRVWSREEGGQSFAVCFAGSHAPSGKRGLGVSYPDIALMWAADVGAEKIDASLGLDKLWWITDFESYTWDGPSTQVSLGRPRTWKEKASDIENAFCIPTAADLLFKRETHKCVNYAYYGPASKYGGQTVPPCDCFDILDMQTIWEYAWRVAVSRGSSIPIEREPGPYPPNQIPDCGFWQRGWVTDWRHWRVYVNSKCLVVAHWFPGSINFVSGTITGPKSCTSMEGIREWNGCTLTYGKRTLTTNATVYDPYYKLGTESVSANNYWSFGAVPIYFRRKGPSTSSGTAAYAIIEARLNPDEAPPY